MFPVIGLLPTRVRSLLRVGAVQSTSMAAAAVATITRSPAGVAAAIGCDVRDGARARHFVEIDLIVTVQRTGPRWWYEGRKGGRGMYM